MATPAHGPDPVDGLRLAMMQRREAVLLKRIGFKSFGVMEWLQLLMVVCGVIILVFADGRSRTLSLVLGWALVLQGIGLWLTGRNLAKSELKQLREKMAALVQGKDGKVIAEAAASAESLLLRK